MRKLEDCEENTINDMIIVDNVEKFCLNIELFNVGENVIKSMFHA